MRIAKYFVNITFLYFGVLFPFPSGACGRLHIYNILLLWFLPHLYSWYMNSIFLINMSPDRARIYTVYWYKISPTQCIIHKHIGAGYIAFSTRSLSLLWVIDRIIPIVIIGSKGSTKRRAAAVRQSYITSGYDNWCDYGEIPWFVGMPRTPVLSYTIIDIIV